MRARDGESGRDGGLRREAGRADRTVRLDVLVRHAIDTRSGNSWTNARTPEYASLRAPDGTAGDHVTAYDPAACDATPDATNTARTTGGAGEAVG